MEERRQYTTDIWMGTSIQPANASAREAVTALKDPSPVAATDPPHFSRASFEQGEGGGEGVLDPKLGVPKMA